MRRECAIKPDVNPEVTDADAHELQSVDTDPEACISGQVTTAGDIGFEVEW